MCDYLSPAIPQDLCVCTDLPCAASCGKVRSHPLWQWGETSVHSSRCGCSTGKSQSNTECWHPAGPLSSTHVENTILCCGFPWARTACLEVTCQALLAHWWLVSTLPQQRGSSAMSWAQPCWAPSDQLLLRGISALWGNVLTSLLKVNMSVRFHSLEYIWFIFPVLFLHVSYLISAALPSLSLSLYSLW